MTPTTRPDVGLAERTAIDVATRFGIGVESPRLLHHSNNVVVYLAPAPIVAKAGAARRDPHAASSLARELEVARFLAARHAPSVHPSRLLPAGPHREGNIEVTFWQYCPHDPDRRLDPGSVGRSLSELHDALAGYAGALPTFAVHIDDAARVLETHPLPDLRGRDRAFLVETHARLTAGLAALPLQARPIHGEAHLGNVLATVEGPRWVDFEAACIGPAEWDLAGLDGNAAAHYPDVDPDLLNLMRDLRSLCVAVWCWTSPDRAPELREAGEYHLRRLQAG